MINLNIFGYEAIVHNILYQKKLYMKHQIYNTSYTHYASTTYTKKEYNMFFTFKK